MSINQKDQIQLRVDDARQGRRELRLLLLRQRAGGRRDRRPFVLRAGGGGLRDEAEVLHSYSELPAIDALTARTEERLYLELLFLARSACAAAAVTAWSSATDFIEK